MRTGTILNLDAKKARLLLLEEKNYCNFDLPDYYSFDVLLKRISRLMGETDISSFFKPIPSAKKILHPKDYENVNHLILANKDGELAWRPFEIIHPVLYVALVHLITRGPNWDLLKKRFADYASTGVLCESTPRKSDTSNSHKAEQVRKWWEKVEQESVKTALHFQYIFDTDISDCYGSIYSHSIAWALHTKKVAKIKRSDMSLLGNQIDKIVQMMRNGQTNGIPQGSMLMDFIAEIILGHIDELLVGRLIEEGVKKADYKIIRYRDDYKIFTNKPEVGKCILRCLSEVLSSWGIKLNSSKTKQQDDSILASIKEDKIDELFVPLDRKNFSKWLFQIYATVSKHPNSGKTARQLSVYHEALLDYVSKNKKLESYENPEVMISIVVNLAIKNPKYYNWCMAILSIFIDYLAKGKREAIIKKIIKKFKTTPNAGLLDVWLQRVTYPVDRSIKFREPLTFLTKKPYPGNKIWCSDWLLKSLKLVVVETPIINFKILAKKQIIINKSEVALFANSYL